MGVDPYLIAPTLKLAIAQRLARKVKDGTGKEELVPKSMKYMMDDTFKSLPEKYKEFDFKKDTKLAGVTSVVNDWVDGDLDAFSQLKVLQPGGDFMQSCWKMLRKVKGGKVISYADLAQKAGNAKAVRAAGSACAKNLVAPFIPCHRVVKTGGAVGNYAFGISLKKLLLTHEGIHNLR
jgi:methylated-DNA-[protein]-cysteine S-methyltransferase